MTPEKWAPLLAFDRDLHDDAVLEEELRKNGGPFIFGANEFKPIGTQFVLAGQPFSIVRIATREEFDARNAELGLEPSRQESVYFFEAATD